MNTQAFAAFESFFGDAANIECGRDRELLAGLVGWSKGEE
jgi:hypothetical protein